ncbi:MAG: MarR family transcriptional regulator [Propionicimonas sp.]
MTDLAALASDLRIACQRVSRRVRFESETELAPHLVSVLGRLSEGPKTPGELAELERISAPSLTRSANCLAERGLIRRDEHPSDGRSKVLALTAEGRDVLGRVVRARDDWMFHKVENLPEADHAVLLRAIEILNREVLA